MHNFLIRHFVVVTVAVVVLLFATGSLILCSGISYRYHNTFITTVAISTVGFVMVISSCVLSYLLMVENHHRKDLTSVVHIQSIHSKASFKQSVVFEIGVEEDDVTKNPELLFSKEEFDLWLDSNIDSIKAMIKK